MIVVVGSAVEVKVKVNCKYVSCFFETRSGVNLQL